MLQRLLMVLIFSIFSITVNAEKVPLIDGFKLAKGVHYKIVPSPQLNLKNQVIEVFYYGCPHCYYLEPSLKKWLKTKPKHIKFMAVPAVSGNDNWTFMANVFYTAKGLGILDKFHEAYFRSIHKENRSIYTLDKLKKFVKPMGVNHKDYDDMFNSFKVKQEVQHARRLNESFGINGVPAVIINGKYITDVSMSGSKENLWKVVNYLIKK